MSNTPDTSISGSAECSLAMADTRDSGDDPSRSRQMSTNIVNSNLLMLPRPRPGRCRDISRDVGDEQLNFLMYVLMERCVPARVTPRTTGWPRPPRGSPRSRWRPASGPPGPTPMQWTCSFLISNVPNCTWLGLISLLH